MTVKIQYSLANIRSRTKSNRIIQDHFVFTLCFCEVSNLIPLYSVLKIKDFYSYFNGITFRHFEAPHEQNTTKSGYFKRLI